MTDLVGQRQLRHLWRNTTVVVHECYYSGVQRAFRALVKTAHGFRVGFVFLADSARCSGRRGNPGKTESAAGEVSVENN